MKATPTQYCELQHQNKDCQMENAIFVVCLLVKQVSSAIVCEENHHAYGLLGSLGLDNLTTQAFGFGIILISLVYYNLVYQKQNRSGRVEIEPSLKEPGPDKNAEPEYPERLRLGHVVFEKTGVEVVSSYKTNDQQVPCDLVLQATSESALPGLLENDELLLSPAIKLISSTKLNGMLEVRIPHGANMILSCQNWNIILKEVSNDRWVPMNQTDRQRIRNFVPKSNHVKFEADHLSTFAIVGRYDKSSLSVYKRMKIAAFCSGTRVGEDLLMRLYCFDDCEWSFERVMGKEQKEGGKLISSIESLNFSVTSEEGVVITIKDVAGWQLDQASSMKISHEALKNSFNTIPQCDLVFHPSQKSRAAGFFVVMAFMQESSSQTVMCASASLKKDPAWSANLKMVHYCRNDVCGENVVKV